jgi:protocatechuate 3,4-dioxygenase beta subunit
VPLTRGAVVTGIITDMFGRTTPDVRVSILEMRTIAAETRLTSAAVNGSNSNVTDDHGVFRIWGLPPGTYVVSASPNNLPNNTTVRTITGTDMEWVQQQLAPGAHATPAPDAGHAVAYSTVYFPGAVDAGSASTIELKAGEERSGINFSLQLVPASTIAGTVIGLDGQPVSGGANVQLGQTGKQAGGSIVLPGFNSRGMGVDRNGKFSLTGITPGAYTLTARGSSRSSAPPPPPPPPFPVVGGTIGGVALPPPPPMSGGGTDLWASLEMNISGDDQLSLVLTLRPGMQMSGRVLFEGAAAKPDVERVRISVSPISNDGLAENIINRPVSADSTFTFSGLTPGRYRPSATFAAATAAPGRGVPVAPATPPGTNPWHLKSVVWQGRDLLDVPLDVRPNEDVTDVTFVFTDATNELSGSLLTGTGDPAPGYFVVVFPVDPALWLANSRRIRQSPPGSDGTFKMTNLPAGAYFMGAVTDLDNGDLGDPAFLQQLSAASLKVTMPDTGKVTQSLRIRGPG